MFIDFSQSRVLRSLKWACLTTLFIPWALAHALELGLIKVLSGGSDPIKISVAVVEEASDALDKSCVQAQMLTPDGILVSGFDLDIVRGSAGGKIILSSPRPASEPAAIISLRVSCRARIRRDYLVFLDSPAQTVLASPADRDSPASSQVAVATRATRPSESQLLLQLTQTLRDLPGYLEALENQDQRAAQKRFRAVLRGETENFSREGDASNLLR